MKATIEITGSNNVILRNLTMADVERLAAIANDPSIGLQLRDKFPYPYTQKDAATYIQAVENDKFCYSWAIITNDILAGVISLILQEDIYRHSAEIGFWLGRDYWSKGIMTEAVDLVCRYGFAELNLIRIYAAVFETNPASLQVLKKNKFVLEGIRTKAILKNKVLLDDCMMALIKR
jgi:RimJ/RimL family protein N-acetyltransferase